MKPASLLPYCLLASQLAAGQTTDSVKTAAIPPKSNFKYGIVSRIGFTQALTDVPNMRSYFRANQIKPNTRFDRFAHWNAGVRYRRFKLLTQGEQGFDMFATYSNDDKVSVARQTRANIAGALLGYDVLDARNRRLYASVGLGSITYEYEVYRRTDEPVDFQNLPQYSQPGNIPALRLVNNYIDFSLELTQREKRRRSAESALRLGYRRGLRPRSWQSDAFVLQGAPRDQVSQIYV